MYEMLFKRRSVRKFKMDEVENLDEIKQFISKIKQLDNQEATFKIVFSEDVKNNKAPYYVIASSKQTTSAYINVGYCLEEIDLYLQKIGLGSLWLGGAKPKEVTLDYTIMLAFGHTDVKYRMDINEFKRKDNIFRLISENMHSFTEEVLSKARLAPSAWNSQPWILDVNSDCIIVNYDGRGLLKNLLKKRMSKIDLGIITKYLEICLIKHNYSIKKILIDEKLLQIKIFYQLN